MAKVGKKALTKSALLAELADKTELSKKQVDTVLTEIVELVKRELSGKGAGKVVIPGLARMTVTKVKAVKGGVEKKNPLTGAMYTTKDKPAYNKVRLSPIKALKEALK
jgi:nucleoid DNA-binding protein